MTAPPPRPPRTGPFRVLAISGSLRAVSSSAVALDAARALAPPDMAIVRYSGLADLPHFNQDLDTDSSRPETVRVLRAEVAAADALLISSPEYAHGVPGSLKNALDWLVSGLEFPAIVIALLNPSPRSTHAYAALVETMTTMSGNVVREASLAIPLSGRVLTPSEVLTDPTVVAPLRQALQALHQALAEARVADRRLVP
jgi:NAD(P)H-dependent FMN reductase